jgi:hypothetical protein
MTDLGMMLWRSGLASALILGTLPAAPSVGDVSRYRSFQLGSDLSTISKQAGTPVSDAKIIHRRPVLIQELQWRPNSLGPSPETESGKDVALRFFDGKLFQITIKYDRYDTEGLTTEDMIEAISATYGTATRLAVMTPTAKQKPYGDEEEVLAQWQDSQYRFDLIRSSYGPTFRLVGVLKELEARAEAAILKAVGLDEQEAPEREAARIASDEKASEAKLMKARMDNKPKFRP